MASAVPILLIFIIAIQAIVSQDVKHTTNRLDQKSNPLSDLILDQNKLGDVNRSEHTKNLSRVKRQFYYNPDYRRRRPYAYPLPIPILIGGGFGFGGFGPGFGGRGFGGRGFGGGGFGGRGFGGGFGGRGIGGGFGGGRGGRG